MPDLIERSYHPILLSPGLIKMAQTIVRTNKSNHNPKKWKKIQVKNSDKKIPQHKKACLPVAKGLRQTRTLRDIINGSA